jgi:hypothetical protein
MIGNLSDPAELYAEEVPAEELNAGENARVVNLFHYHKDVAKAHGVPCKFVVLEVSIVTFQLLQRDMWGVWWCRRRVCEQGRPRAMRMGCTGTQS